MVCRLLGMGSILAAALWCTTAAAQLPGPLGKGGVGESQEALPRRPNDQIEGAVWQYRATRKGAEEELTGRFRVDEKLVFALEAEVRLPERPREGRPLQRLVEGDAGKVKLPEPPQQKRIGECKTLSSGRVRMDFQPDSPLPGYVIVRPKKDAQDVWWGTYYQARQGDQPGLKWDIELRKAED